MTRPSSSCVDFRSMRRQRTFWCFSKSATLPMARRVCTWQSAIEVSTSLVSVKVKSVYKTFFHSKFRRTPQWRGFCWALLASGRREGFRVQQECDATSLHWEWVGLRRQKEIISNWKFYFQYSMQSSMSLRLVCDDRISSSTTRSSSWEVNSPFCMS